MSVLVTGGAGYIGSHVALALIESGETVVVLDDLSTGFKEAVPHGASFVQGDMGDTELVSNVLADHNVEAVLHFAAHIVVPESVSDPLKYYKNNSAKTALLLDAVVRHGIRSFVFSSTAAVYGDQDGDPVTEDVPVSPLNPYAQSKLFTEYMLRDADAAYGLKSIVLRYFNVAGADPQGRSGQSTKDATHLIKVATEVALGARPRLEIFGDDYQTPDGTCVRDYIHVTDLADAHVKALNDLRSKGRSGTYNCGYGRGYSVKQVVDALEAEIGHPISKSTAPRRPGDSVAIVANSDRLRRELGWTPRHDDLRFIVRTALQWEEKRLQRQNAS